MKYSKEPIHELIKSFAEVEEGEVIDECEEYFSLKLPNYKSALQLTYQPVIARERNIDLIASGTPAFEKILKKCMDTGHVCFVSLNINKSPIEQIDTYFKDSDVSCDFCEKMEMNKKDYYFCVKTPRCYHKINNTKIDSIDVLDSKKIKLFQFYFLVSFRNKLKKTEEIIKLLLDEDGNLFDYDIIDKNDDVELLDCNDSIPITKFESVMNSAYQKLDVFLKNKKSVFDLLLKKEITRRISKVEEKLEEQRLQQSISKKAELFDQKAWEQKKNHAIQRETKALQTQISTKFINLLIVSTSKINFEIVLSNKAKIISSLITGLTDKFEIECPLCGQMFESGYGTVDGYYVCNDCIQQSIETGKIYSSKFQLARDNTTNEFIESDKGFVCSVCGTQNSTKMRYVCSNDESEICFRCYEICNKCQKIFSRYNLETCVESKQNYCSNHVIHCDSCGNPVGIDKYFLCKASGKMFCSCTTFQKCELCEIDYSSKVLENNKCPACNNLKPLETKEIVAPVLQSNSKYKGTKNWVVGKNAKNNVIVAKGRFSDTLFVVEDEKVISSNKLSLFKKMRGY